MLARSRGLRVARILVVGKSTMLLRRTTAMQDSRRLMLSAFSLGGKEEGNAALDDRMHR